MLRISSGLLKGLPLSTPPTSEYTRPSTEKTRQALFNFLRHYLGASGNCILEDAVIGDVFAGTGALGLEASGFGAKQVVFIESHFKTLPFLKKNIAAVASSFVKQSIEPAPVFELLSKDVRLSYALLPELDVMFCDPPYGKNWIEEIAKLEAEKNRLKPSGLLIFEASMKDETPAKFEEARLQCFETKIYGDSKVVFFVKR